MSDPTLPANANELGKDYPEGFRGTAKTAVRRLSFTVPRGSIYGLVGPNGAGKSTTLHLLLGFLRPTRGKVSLFGRDPGERESRRSLGFLPELFRFDRFSTGRRVLARFDALAGRGPAGRNERIADSLRAVGLEADASRRVGTYSKGMAQRIGLAQAILGDPELLILDEPMSGMDPASRSSVKALLLQRRSQGKTTLFSTHILSDVEDIADRLLILHRGESRFEGRLSELPRGATVVRFVLRASDPDRAQEEIRRLGDEVVPRAGAETLTVDVPEGQPADEFLGRVPQIGASIVSLNPHGTSLESVFLELTGSDPENARA